MEQMWYVSPNGVQIDLVKPGDWSRRVAYAGVSGLVGKKTASSSIVVNRPGQSVHGFRTMEMTGVLTFQIAGGVEGSSDDLYAELVREFDAELPGMLFVRRESLGILVAKVRLNGEIAWPDSWLDAGDNELQVSVPLISDDGVWETLPMSGTGVVTVANGGDEFLYPTVAWSNNVTVTLPSGIDVSLPAPVDGKIRRLSLDPYTSHEVLRHDNTVDEELSEITAQLLLGEGVPRSQSRQYAITGSGTIEWSLKYLNPGR